MTSTDIMMITPRRAEREKARAAYLAAVKSDAPRDIRAAYVRPSAYKTAAWSLIVETAATYPGADHPRVAGATCMAFSAAFAFDTDDGKRAVCWITRAYERYALMDPAEDAAAAADYKAACKGCRSK